LSPVLIGLSPPSLIGFQSVTVIIGEIAPTQRSTSSLA
jgi:hypothetical protein